MDAIYLYCALIGGTVLVVQTVLLLIGVGAHGLDADVGADFDGPDGHDIGHAEAPGDHGTSLFVKVLTFKSVVAFLTFFGLTGLAAGGAGWSTGATALAALGAGVAALFAVAQMMSMLAKLTASGSLDLANAVGATGRVYLRIPASHAGQGKIHVTVQGRTVEVRAKTAGPQLDTGVQARVVRLLDGDTVEVISAEA